MEQRLTQFSPSSGCGCKIHLAKLEEILTDLKQEARKEFPYLLVGNQHADDAAVYQINQEQAIIHTSDFFTPIVDDPFLFGQIAAANALSDVYAMGGTPLMANALLCCPVEQLSAEVASQMLKGARHMCYQAGIPLAGGHSINLKEIAFGLSVVGVVHPDKVLTNAGAQPHDLIFLTKPLGIGILSTALKRNLLSQEGYRALVRYATALNDFGAQLSNLAGIHALTDVTGFGFYGHLLEMCRAAQLSAIVDFDCIPRLAEAEPYAKQFVIPDNALRNWNSYCQFIDTKRSEAFTWLNDPQTNGGLLVAVAPERQQDYIEAAQKAGLPSDAWKPIGQFVPLKEHLIYVH
ncbi:MAG: selenide, water dikinase SelD [Cytophagales bacterium]|nr:selenide, water dikinase SelD [Bernardetiaceae bacterium]MDW8210986.1 selenide, water dikinase SelD [Cytophagales bacterium]